MLLLMMLLLLFYFFLIFFLAFFVVVVVAVVAVVVVVGTVLTFLISLIYERFVFKNINQSVRDDHLVLRCLRI